MNERIERLINEYRKGLISQREFLLEISFIHCILEKTIIEDENKKIQKSFM